MPRFTSAAEAFGERDRAEVLEKLAERLQKAIERFMHENQGRTLRGDERITVSVSPRAYKVFREHGGQIKSDLDEAGWGYNLSSGSGDDHTIPNVQHVGAEITLYKL